MSRDTLDNPALFATAVRGLSLLNFECHEARTTDSFVKWRGSHGKHVVLSDAIASIMIVNPQHLVVAINIRLEAEKLTILWAHNSTAPPDAWEKNYYDNLIRLFQSKADCKIILRVVVQSCQPKIISRIKKFISSIGGDDTAGEKKISNFFNVNMEKKSHQAVRDSLVKRRVIGEGQTLSKAFDSFIFNLKEAIGKDFDLDRLVRLVSMCHTFRSTEPRLGPPGPQEDHLPNPPAALLDHQSYSRLCKIGDYKYACMVIQRSIEKNLQPPQIQNIHLKQVFPPEPVTLNVPQTLVGCLNAWVGKNPEYQAVEHFRDVQAEYTKAQSGGRTSQDQNIEATLRQHAETTIALKVMEEQQKVGFFEPIEIGVSKACCDWCHTWLLEYGGLRPPNSGPIVYRATHGKRPDNWAMPANTPSSIMSTIFKTINLEMRMAVESAKRHRRKSDTPTIDTPASGEQDEIFQLDPDEPWDDEMIEDWA